MGARKHTSIISSNADFLFSPTCGFLESLAEDFDDDGSTSFWVGILNGFSTGFGLNLVKTNHFAKLVIQKQNSCKLSGLHTGIQTSSLRSTTTKWGCENLKCMGTLPCFFQLYFTKEDQLLWHLGPVVQSIVSLTSSLRGQLVKCFTAL